MKRGLQKTLWILLLLLLGCGGTLTGGSEAGNPDTTVVGSLTKADNSDSNSTSNSGCEADTVVVADTLDRETETAVESDCSFELELISEVAYRIDFLKAGDYVATLSFENSPGRFSSPAMFFSSGTGALFLDQISIRDEAATPGREISEQSDQDGDGVDDFTDSDDDGNGIEDTEEADCDLDGIIDSQDEDNSDCASNPGDSASNQVLEVTPRNGDGRGARRNKSHATDQVKARFSCDINPDTLTLSSFQIFPQGDVAGAIECSFTLHASGRTVICDHASSFEANTVYEAHLEGVECADGSPIPSTTWTWQTKQ